jgi:hypothetical protein
VNVDQALFKMVQRLYVIAFLFNTLLIYNIFNFFYLGVSTYLLLKKTSISSIRILNYASLLAITVQYIFLLLNFQLDPKQLPYPLNNSTNFNTNTLSVIQHIGIINPYTLSYLGFSSGYLVDPALASEQNY